VLGGDRHTPLLLICRSGERSMRAAQMLRAAGHEHVAVVTGGFEGEIGTDGKRHGGWKDAGLPWVARADEALIFGPSD
jgi:rhodanese-related sulfurtransferase